MTTFKPARVFGKVYSQKSLAQLYTNHMASSKTIGLDRISAENFSQNLATETALIEKKVAAGTYRFTTYRERLISKGAAKLPRVLSIPTIRDRLTLRTYCEFLNATFPSASSDLAQVKVAQLGRAIASKNYTHFVKVDVEDFYPSIDHKRLLSKVRKRIRKKEALSLLTAAISNSTASQKVGGKNAVPSAKGVPQGLSISNVLAEIYLQSFDQSFADQTDIFYSRYVDDILVLCGDDFKKIEGEVVSGLKGLRLKPHEMGKAGAKSKQGTIQEGFDYLGYEFKNGRISVRRSSELNLENSIVQIFSSYKHSLGRCKTDEDRVICQARLLWHLNLRLTGCIYKGQRLGWVFYFSQLNDTGVLRGIDNTVSTLLRRFKVPTEVKPKRALKTYYESVRVDKTTHSYIPNFDEIQWPEQVKILMSLGFPVHGKTAAQITSMFQKKIGAAVSDLEKDLQQLS